MMKKPLVIITSILGIILLILVIALLLLGADAKDNSKQTAKLNYIDSHNTITPVSYPYSMMNTNSTILKPCNCLDQNRDMGAISNYPM